MNILLLNDYRTGGGCEEMVEQTAGVLRRAGAQVTIFTKDDVPGHRRTPLGYIDSRRCRAALARTLEAVRPDVVHLHNFYHELSPGILATLRAYRARSPLRVVMTAHDFHLLCPSPLLLTWSRGCPRPLDLPVPLRLRDLVRRRWDHRGAAHTALKVAQHLWNYRIRRRAGVIDLVLCPSAFLERLFRSAGFPTRRLAHPGPAIHDFKATRPDDQLRLVFAGRVEPEKGLALLLEAMPEEPMAALAVVGDGSELERCRAVCRRHGWTDRVDFLGRQSRQRTLELIASSHVLVLPSVCVENAPLCLMEALSVGTNILCGTHGGQGEVVRESGVGFLFNHDDPATLHEALAQIERDRRRGVLNSFDARRYLERHDEAAHLRGLLEAFGADAAPHATLAPAGAAT